MPSLNPHELVIPAGPSECKSIFDKVRACRGSKGQPAATWDGCLLSFRTALLPAALALLRS